ncbi:hypothetical protein yinte0001_9420 [Yersinia intermedia ATCC 29909]|nr:hypothetical protein yinte0001_9420 [Yersinia intermedia ATCC 29909]
MLAVNYPPAFGFTIFFIVVQGSLIDYATGYKVETTHYRAGRTAADSGRRTTI